MTKIKNDSLSPDTLPPVFDFRLVAFLHKHAIPFEMRGYERIPGQEAVIGFILPNEARVLLLIAKYHANESVPVLDFIRAEKHVKDAMFPVIRSIRSGKVHPLRMTEGRS